MQSHNPNDPTQDGADSDEHQHDEEGDFYSPLEARFYILAYLLGRAAEVTLLEELSAIGEKLEADDEKHTPDLLRFEDRAVEKLRTRFPKADFFHAGHANEEVSGLLRRFEILHLIELVDEHEDPWAVGRAKELLAALSKNFEEALEAAEDSLFDVEDNLLAELQNMDESEHDHDHDHEHGDAEEHR